VPRGAPYVARIRSRKSVIFAALALALLIGCTGRVVAA
jgi:hypothetical protein